jgi:hypothetical protein
MKLQKEKDKIEEELLSTRTKIERIERLRKDIINNISVYDCVLREGGIIE